MMEVKNLLRELMDEIPVGIGDGETVDEETDDDIEASDGDVDEASSGGVAGFAAPLHYDPESGRRMKKMYSRHYKTVGPDLKPKP